MLAPRYRNDGRAGAPLNALQENLRDQVERKVRTGEYPTETVPCAVCGHKNEHVLSEKDRYGLSLRVVACQDCGLIYTSPRMTQNAYARFYDEEYRPLYHGEKHPAGSLFAKTEGRGRSIAQFLQRQRVTLEGRRVLEVGCGSGGILQHLRKNYGCEVVGCDYGAEGIEYGREKHGLNLQVGEIEEVQGADFDLIIYSHVFEHILEPIGECARIEKALAPDGVLYLEVPSVKAIRSRYDWDFLELLQNAHTYHFTLRSLTNILHRGGFGRVAGTEYVRSIFRPSQSVGGQIQSDYEDALAFLRRTERLRGLGLGRLVKSKKAIRRAARAGASRVARAAGLR